MKPYYEQDGVTLYHGDCADVLPVMGVKSNLILTSPPYDNLRNYGGHGFDFDRVADTCVGALADGGVLVWVVADGIDGNHSESGASFRHALGFMERGLRLHDTMIFYKGNPGNWTPNRYQQDWEYMFVFSQGTPRCANMLKDRPNVTAGAYRPNNFGKGRGREGKNEIKPRVRNTAEYGLRSGIWRYAVGNGNLGHDSTQTFEHPATFPYALASDHILTWTNPGDVVLDPMAGSGTTLRAAKNLGRKAMGVEIHEDYLPIITERMAQSTMALA